MNESLGPLTISQVCRDTSISAFQSVSSDDEKVFCLVHLAKSVETEVYESEKAQQARQKCTQ